MELHGKEKFTAALAERLALTRHAKPLDELTEAQAKACRKGADEVVAVLGAERCSVIWADKDGTSHVIQ